MRKALDHRRRSQRRFAAILTAVMAIAGGMATFGAVTAIGSVQIAMPSALKSSR
jgi:hypothetical protein